MFFFCQLTHNPNAIKLHGILIEIEDFLSPPHSRRVSEEVRDCCVCPVFLGRWSENDRMKPNNIQKISYILISVFTSLFQSCPSEVEARKCYVSGEILYLYLGFPVQRFIYCDIGVIWPDLKKVIFIPILLYIIIHYTLFCQLVLISLCKYIMYIAIHSLLPSPTQFHHFLAI